MVLNSRSGHRILVPGNNETNQSLILDMLSIHGHEAAVVRNGREAVELAQSFRPELATISCQNMNKIDK